MYFVIGEVRIKSLFNFVVYKTSKSLKFGLLITFYFLLIFVFVCAYNL